MRIINGLHVLLVSTIFCGTFQIAFGQSSAKAEVLAALAERDKAFVAGDETKVAQFMSEDYLQTDVSGNIQDKQAWLNEYYRPMAPLLQSGKTRWVTFERSDIVVRDLGDTMVVAGKQTIKHVGVDPWNPEVTTPPDSPRAPLALRFTHVWIKRRGAWKLAVVHNAIPRERK
jgi:ketosteroid isomerase-like protein